MHPRRRKLLTESEFQFEADWVRVLTGQEEGLFGFVGVNFATGQLQVGGVEVIRQDKIS